jgi:peptide/nickel transport system permease protein
MRRILILLPLLLILACAILHPQMRSEPWLGPALERPLGTDEFGRDALLVLLAASGRSLAFGAFLAVVVTIIALGLAYMLVFRASPAVRGTALAAVQIVESVPVVIWVLVAFSAAGAASKSIAALVFFIAILPFSLALIAGEFWRLRERPYIDAALLLGSNVYRLLRWHLVPNAISVLLPLLVQIVGLAIMIEGAIGLLGFTNRTDLDLGVVLLRGKENVTAHPALLISTLVTFAIIFMALQLAERAFWADHGAEASTT